jgi:hypothetical protein
MVIYGHVSGSALDTEVRRLVEEWRLIAPGEYEAWGRNCKAQKDYLRDARAFTKGRLMQFQCTLPAHVHLGIGRFLQDHNWTQDPRNLEIVLSVLQNARMPAKKA